MFTRWHHNIWITSTLLIAIALVCTSPDVYSPNGLPVHLDGEVFLGREAEVEMLSEWIGNSTVNIISIVGSPGFGKSALAIHVGQVIAEMGGVALHYADLYEVRDITSLMKELIFLVHDKDKQSSDLRHLSMWASKLKVPTVLILDNCDEVLHKYKNDFQNLVKKLVKQSRFLTVMLTAKHMTSFLGSFRNLTLTELPTSSAADVLQNLSSTLNRTMALEIAGLVGSVPLALQVVGSLLTQVDPSTIANELRKNPIPALSPELLSSTERVFTSLNISYHYLTPQHQRCGMLLANFPGSFDNSAVLGILEGKLVNDTSKCLKALQHKSLLSYDAHTQRYRYHQLIKEFFTFTSSELIQEGSEQLNNTFFLHYEAYYGKIMVQHYSDGANECYHFQDTERSNIDFLTTNRHKINPKCNKSLMNVFGNLGFALSEIVLDTLHLCKSAHKNPQLLVRLKLIERRIHIIGTLKNVTKALQNIPLLYNVSLDQAVQRLTTGIAYLYSYILHGDIHYGVSLGIKIGQQGLISFDYDFTVVSKQRGLSVSLDQYVNLVIQLSKLEAIVHGKQKAIEVLLLRYERITELYSYASTNDMESRQVYIKYHSALERNYILLGQYHKFLEHRKKVLQLKWSLAKCKQVDCTPTHLALAHFGRGDYEESAKYLEALLQSKSLKGNGRVQLFILLYESYRNLGNAERAAHLLTKDHHILRFPSIRNITATDYVNSTNLSVRYKHHGDHSETWLLNKECMIVSGKNSRTCLILAGFYRSLQSEDATKLGNILNCVLRHFVRRRHNSNGIRWYKYGLYSQVSEYKGRSNFEILAFLGILFVAVFGCIVMLRL